MNLDWVAAGAYTSRNLRTPPPHTHTNTHSNPNPLARLLEIWFQDFKVDSFDLWFHHAGMTAGMAGVYLFDLQEYGERHYDVTSLVVESFSQIPGLFSVPMPACSVQGRSHRTQLTKPTQPIDQPN